MVLKMSAFNVLSSITKNLKPTENGILTIDCSEMDTKEGYLKLSVFDSLGESSKAQDIVENPYQIPLRYHSPVLSITSSFYEMYAFYKHQGDDGIGKLDVIFLYEINEKILANDKHISFFSDVKLFFSKPDRTLSVALKYYENK